jgi:hypothetical protein
MKKSRSKREPFIIVLGGSLISIFLYLLCDQKIERSPVLEFKGYEYHGTNRDLFAKFELRNVTARPMWLLFSGKNFPLNTTIMQRPLVKVPEPTNVYSLSAGSFFMNGEKVSPGENFEVDFSLASNTPLEKIGVYYYTGKFKDGNDFISSLVTPVQRSDANLMGKVAYLWEKAKNRYRGPTGVEVWCDKPISFQTGARSLAEQINSEKP